MHILVLPSWYPNKGNLLSGIFFKEQAEALAKQKNIQVGCIALNESSPRYIFSKKEVTFDFYEKSINNVNTISILYPIANRLKGLRRFVRKKVFSILFRKYIKKHGKPDLLHLHSFLYGDLAIWVKEKYQINYVVTEHSSGFFRNKFNSNELSFAKNIFMNSRYNMCVSNEFKKLLEKNFNINFFYIPNSIDTEYFIPNSIEKTNFEFINIAFLNKNKNQSMLIEAFRKTFSEDKNVNLTIVGSGSEYNNLNNLIEKLNMKKQVKLYGVANRKEILELLQNSDAFVLSSKYETFGVVVIEAMSCGIPVVATKCGGPESIVINEKLGELVEINTECIASGMKKVYQKSYSQKYIRHYAIENFSEEVVVLKLKDVYDKVLK